MLLVDGEFKPGRVRNLTSAFYSAISNRISLMKCPCLLGSLSSQGSRQYPHGDTDLPCHELHKMFVLAHVTGIGASPPGTAGLTG